MQTIIILVFLLYFFSSEQILCMQHPQEGVEMSTGSSGETKKPHVTIHVDDDHSLTGGVSVQVYFRQLLMVCTQDQKPEQIAALKSFIVAHRTSIVSQKEFPGQRRYVGPVRFVVEYAEDKKTEDLVDFLLDNNFEWLEDDGVLDEYCMLIDSTIYQKLTDSPGYKRALKRKNCRDKACAGCLTLAFSALMVLAGWSGHK